MPQRCQAVSLTYELENDHFEDVRQTQIAAIFNRLTPCFKEVLEHPPADEPIDHKVFTPATD